MRVVISTHSLVAPHSTQPSLAERARGRRIASVDFYDNRDVARNEQNSGKNHVFPKFVAVRPEGVEPPTFGSEVWVLTHCFEAKMPLRLNCYHEHPCVASDRKSWQTMTVIRSMLHQLPYSSVTQKRIENQLELWTVGLSSAPQEPPPRDHASL